MDVLVLIDKLDDLIHNAKPIPMSDKVRVDKEEIYDILDQMRATIPEEIKQARWIVKERQEMLAEAKREAERIVKEARERAEQLVSQEEVTKEAERAAEDIIEDARAREREIRLGAEDYADDGSARIKLASGELPRISPDGTTVAYETPYRGSTRPTLRVIPAAGGASRLLLKPVWFSFGFAPDSRTIAAVTGKEVGRKSLV